MYEPSLNRGQLPGAIAAELASRIWSDPVFASRYENDAAGTLSEMGLDLSPSEIVLPGSPAGDIPFEGPSQMMATTVYACATSGCGTFYSLTTECGCSNTTTGSCSCGTIFGTNCWTCT